MSDYFDEMGWTPLRDGEAPNVLLQMARLFRDIGMWELLGEHEKLPPPASKTAVEGLESVEITSDASKQCPVCLKDFEEGDSAKMLPCKHTFHQECILPWLEKVRPNIISLYNVRFMDSMNIFSFCKLSIIFFTYYLADEFVPTVQTRVTDRR